MLKYTENVNKLSYSIVKGKVKFHLFYISVMMVCCYDRCF